MYEFYAQLYLRLSLSSYAEQFESIKHQLQQLIEAGNIIIATYISNFSKS